jgi:CcmD family protein
VSEWAYVTAAYTIVWGALAVYAVVLARRVAQARDVARALTSTDDPDDVECDDPSTP